MDGKISEIIDNVLDTDDYINSNTQESFNSANSWNKLTYLDNNNKMIYSFGIQALKSLIDSGILYVVNKTSALNSINVIGKNVDEACMEIDKYLDECALGGLISVSIIHGKGTGILRKGVQSFLKTHPHVKSYRDGLYGEGEQGVTIVELK